MYFLEMKNNWLDFGEFDLLFKVTWDQRTLKNAFSSSYLLTGLILTENRRVSFEFGWLVDLGLTVLWDSISVYIGPSPREREKERETIDERKNVQTTPTRTYFKRSRPCPTLIQISRTGRPEPLHHPTTPVSFGTRKMNQFQWLDLMSMEVKERWKWLTCTISLEGMDGLWPDLQIYSI